jgi:hypothetical protein
MSVNHPLKMRFFRFANSGAALADAMAGILFGSMPGVLMIVLVNRQTTSATAGIALLLVLYGGLYWLSLVRFGRRFEQSEERIASLLSG